MNFMKKITLLFVLTSLMFGSIFGNNLVLEKSNRVYFTLDSKNLHILIPVYINDSIVSNMIFDTGANSNRLNIDSSVCAQHKSILLDRGPNIVGKSGSAWDSKDVSISVYNMNQKAQIGLTDLTFDKVGVYNLKKLSGNPKLEGLFGFPKNDTTHVWELNFENNYLEIHSANEFKMPSNCFIAPIITIKDCPDLINIQLPLHIRCSDGDTLSMNQLFTIDTGMYWDVALMYNSTELPFFNKKDNAIWIKDKKNYFRYYSVDAKAFNNQLNDSLRIYTFDYRNDVNCKYLIGANFLKRFNVFFDFKNRQVGFQPITNFQRISYPYFKQYYISIQKTPKGKYFITNVANYKTNKYKMAGLRKGDEIIKLDEKPYKDITSKDVIEIAKKEFFSLDIIRKGKPIRLIVKKNINEITGD